MGLKFGNDTKCYCSKAKNDCYSISLIECLLQVPDVGAEVTGGCYGFATKYMHWQEDLILGGVRKNQTGHIVRAEAMQSVFLMKGEHQMYEYWKEDQKTMNIDWTLEKAKMVLETWHRKFTDVSEHK